MAAPQSHFERLAQAVQILSDIPDKSILEYCNVLKNDPIREKIKLLVNEPGRPPNGPVLKFPGGNYPPVRHRSHLTVKDQPSKAQLLIGTLLEKGNAIKQFMSKDVDKAVGQIPPAEDYRVVDIYLATGDCLPRALLRRALAQCSLAEEFRNWDCKQLPKARSGNRNGNILAFVRTTFPDEKRSIDGSIRHGKKLLGIEARIGIPAVSALLAFAYTRLLRVPVKEIAEVVTLLKSKEFKPWLDLANGKSEWFENANKYYSTQGPSLSNGKQEIPYPHEENHLCKRHQALASVDDLPYQAALSFQRIEAKGKCTPQIPVPSSDPIYGLQPTSKNTSWHHVVLSHSDTHPDSNLQDRTLCSIPQSLQCGKQGTRTLHLVLLLHSLGNFPVPRDILLRGLSPQPRWDGNGSIRNDTLMEAGLNEQYARLFSISGELEYAINTSIQRNLISVHNLEDGSHAYSPTSDQIVQISRSFQQDALMLQGLIFTTHIFPREDTLKPASFKPLDTGKPLLPHLQRFWDYVLRGPCQALPGYARESLVEATLEASRFAGASHFGNKVIARMQECHLADHILLAIVNRRSMTLRLKGDLDSSDTIITEILQRTRINDTRSHCLYGRLLLSRVENAILRENLEGAECLLDQWEAENDPPSIYELHVVRLKNTARARVLRYRGRFELAAHFLEQCLGPVQSTASRYHVLHHLADIYCELKQENRAEELLRDEIEGLRISGKEGSKAYRRLLLPMAEALIQLNRFKEATTILEYLTKTFDGMSGHDASDQLGHVRSVLGLMRIAYLNNQWPKAVTESDKALSVTQSYETFSSRSFYIRLIYLFRTVLFFEIGERVLSEQAFSLALQFEQTPRKFSSRHGHICFTPPPTEDKLITLNRDDQSFSMPKQMSCHSIG